MSDDESLRKRTLELLEALSLRLDELAQMKRPPSDWLTEAEAASYCRVSLTSFRAYYLSTGITARRAFGKKLYSRDDIFQAILRSPTWDREPLRWAPAVSIGVQLPPGVNLSAARVRPYKPRKHKAEDSGDQS